MEEYRKGRHDVADVTRLDPKIFARETQKPQMLGSVQAEIASEASENTSSMAGRSSPKSTRIHKRSNSNKKLTSCCNIRGSTADCEHCLVSTRLKQIYQVKPLSLGEIDLKPFEPPLLAKQADTGRNSMETPLDISDGRSASMVSLNDLRLPPLSRVPGLAAPPLQTVEPFATTSTLFPFGKDRSKNA